MNFLLAIVPGREYQVRSFGDGFLSIRMQRVARQRGRLSGRRGGGGVAECSVAATAIGSARRSTGWRRSPQPVDERAWRDLREPDAGRVEEGSVDAAHHLARSAASAARRAARERLRN